MSKCARQSIAFVLIFSMILSILIVPVAAEETEYTVLLSQDFESYPVYEAGNADTYGEGMLGSGTAKQVLTGGAQHVVWGGSTAGSSNGLLSVRQEGENKYLDFRTAAGTYPTIYYHMAKPVTGEDVMLSVDVTPGSGRIYLRPYFSDQSGNTVKSIQNFMIFYPIDTDNVYAYYNSNKTANNGTNIVTMAKGWNRVELHFNMTEKTYWVDFKNRETGEIVEQISENLIPTTANGSGTFDEYFNGITHLEGVEFVGSNHGGSDSLNGSGDPGKLDNFSISVVEQPETDYGLEMAVSEGGSVKIDRSAAENGQIVKVIKDGFNVEVVPDAGYQIQSIVLGGETIEVSDPQQYTGFLQITENTKLEVLFTLSGTAKSLLYQDFESYTPYDGTNGTYGTMLHNQTITGGTQDATNQTGHDITGTYSLLAIRSDDNNKNLEVRAKSGEYPQLTYRTTDAFTGSNIKISIDFKIGDYTLFFRPRFTNSARGNGTTVNNFIKINSGSLLAFYGSSNAYHTLSISKDWCTMDVYMNMETLTYRVELKDKATGATLGATTDSALPGASADRNYIGEIQLVCSCSGDSLTGTANPLYIDNIKFATVVESDVNFGLDVAFSEGGSLKIDGLDVGNNTRVDVEKTGFFLQVTPDTGYMIKSIALDGKPIEITDSQQYLGNLKITQDSKLEIEFDVAGVAKKLLYQDFESYTPYDGTNGTYGMMLNNQSVTGGRQRIGDEAAVNGTNGLIAVRSDGNNKYIEAKLKKDQYPYLLYDTPSPFTGKNLLISVDFKIGDSQLYFRPRFANKDGSNGQNVNNFIIINSAGLTAYYSTNSTHTLSVPQSWCTLEVSFDMEQLKYRVVLKDKVSGNVLGAIEESDLPSGGATLDAFYGSRKYFAQLELTSRCDTDSFTGTALPLYIDNVSFADADVPYKLTPSITGNGTVSVNGTAVESGETAIIRATGTKISVVPDEGYKIASVSLNGVEQKLQNLDCFEIELSVRSNTEVKVVFVKGYETSVSISGGQAVVTLDGIAVSDGDKTVISEIGTVLSVVPEDGYKIQKITLNGQLLTVSDIYNFNGTVTTTKNCILEIVLKPGYELAREFYVSVDGDDNNEGTKEKPFATLEKARDKIREYNKKGIMPVGGVTVYIREGVYHPTRSFILNEQDSGREDAPIVYRAYPGEKVSISGGVEIDYSKFKPVEGEMKNLLRSKEAQGKVVVADLSEVGITLDKEFSVLNHASLDIPIFLFDGHSMSMAHWPNEIDSNDWPKAKVLNRGEDVRHWNEPQNNGTGMTTIAMTEEIPLSWTYRTDDYFWFGYWYYEWYAEYFQGVFDKSSKTVVAKHKLMYGGDEKSSAYQGIGQPYKVYNVYEEIDEPGEWYIDRDENKMYFYPYETTSATPQFKMTKAEFDLITVNNASNITFSGIELTSGKKSAVSVTNSSNVVLDRCDVNAFEGIGVVISGGFENGVQNGTVYNCGIGGITIEGGDRETITPSGHFVKNNIIHDWSLMKETYGFAVEADGVGTIVSHNEFYNAPHGVVYYTGVDHVIEYNIFHDVVRNSGDMGAIYTGRNLADHGNIVRYNHFYNIGSGDKQRRMSSNAFFTDDGSCDTEVYGNVFGTGVTTGEALKVHGGMANSFRNNLFIDVPHVIWLVNWVDSRFKQSILGTSSYDSEQTLQKTWETIKGNELYYERWPWLRMLENVEEDYVYQSTPLGRNVFIYINEERASDYILLLRNVKEALSETDTNLLLENGNYENLLKDFEGGNFALTDEAYRLIWQSIPDFEEIPFEAMGPYQITNSVPSASNVQISVDGNQLTATYVYHDSAYITEGTSKYRWLISDSLDGSYQPIGGATSKTYSYTDAEKGKYIKFEVTPVNSEGTAGKAVLSQAMAIVPDWDGFAKLMQAIETEKDKAVVGNALGQYPASAVKELEEALEQAKGAKADGNSLEEATEELNQAYEVFKEQQIASLKQTTTSGTIAIPSGLRQLELDLGDLTGEVKLATDGFLPDTVIWAIIHGVPVQIELPAGSYENEISVLTPLDQPGASVIGDPYVSFIVGEAGKTLDQPWKITVTDGAKTQAFTVADGSAERLKNARNENDSKIFSLEQGGEILLAVMRAATDDATLSQISVNGISVKNFNSNKENCGVFLPKGTVSAEVSVETSSEYATVVPAKTQTAAVPGAVTFTVTAEDGVTTKTYTVKLLLEQDTAVSPSPTVNPISQPGGTGTGTIMTPGTGTVNRPILDDTSGFTDIIGHWAEKDINAMAAKGIVSGVTNILFEPDRYITRAEFTTLLVRTLNLSSSVSCGFVDLEADAWYVPYVNAAANSGLVSGYNGDFRPNDLITREEMAVVLTKAYTFLGKTAERGGIEKFADADQISDWARPYVDVAAAVGLMAGVTADTFAGTENSTRAQAASVFYRLLQK